MKRIFLALAIVLTFTGCASTDYAQYASIHVERSKTEAARYDALASIARHSNDQTTRVAAAMALAMGGSANVTGGAVSAPQNEALQWGNLLVNGATSLYGLRVGAAIKLGDMSRGAADKDVLNNAMSTLDIIRNTDEVK